MRVQIVLLQISQSDLAESLLLFLAKRAIDLGIILTIRNSAGARQTIVSGISPKYSDWKGIEENPPFCYIS